MGPFETDCGLQGVKDVETNMIMGKTLPCAPGPSTGEGAHRGKQRRTCHYGVVNRTGSQALLGIWPQFKGCWTSTDSDRE